MKELSFTSSVQLIALWRRHVVLDPTKQYLESTRGPRSCFMVQGLRRFQGRHWLGDGEMCFCSVCRWSPIVPIFGVSFTVSCLGRKSHRRRRTATSLLLLKAVTYLSRAESAYNGPFVWSRIGCTGSGSSSLCSPRSSVDTLTDFHVDKSWTVDNRQRPE